MRRSFRLRRYHYRYPWRARTWLLTAGVGVAAIVAAIVFVVTNVGSSTSAAPVFRETSAELATAVGVTPQNGTSSLPLDSPVRVTTSVGHLTSVSVVSGTGQSLTGGLDPTSTEWTSSQSLAASATYLVTATVKDPSGQSATTHSSFTTLTPDAWVHASVFPDNGMTVGVGQPIVLKFSRSVTDPATRQALLSHLSVSASNPVPVGAYWFSGTEMHLRPQNYWPAHDQVAISTSLDGWDAGNGNWGEGAVNRHFSIGDARISTADLTSHQMTVTLNGSVAATYPISAGRDQYPTMDGIHLAMDRSQVVHMVSSTVGIPVNSPDGYDEFVYWDVQISDSGEYVHAAPWSVGAQGNTNVSHGCINLSPDNATQFYNFSAVGDVINVINGPRAPVSGDHGVMDWDTPWSSFTPVNVSPL